MTDAFAAMVQVLSSPAVTRPRRPARRHRLPRLRRDELVECILTRLAAGVTYTRICDECRISRRFVAEVARADATDTDIDFGHMGDQAMQRYRVVSDVAHGLLMQEGPLAVSQLVARAVFAAAVRKEGLAAWPNGRKRSIMLVAQTALRSLRQQGRVRLQGHKWVAL